MFVFKDHNSSWKTYRTKETTEDYVCCCKSSISKTLLITYGSMLSRARPSMINGQIKKVVQSLNLFSPFATTIIINRNKAQEFII